MCLYYRGEGRLRPVTVVIGSTRESGLQTLDPPLPVRRRIGTAPGSLRDAPGGDSPTGCRPSPFRPSARHVCSRSLLREYRESGDQSARERLIAEYLPLVRALARRYAGRGEQFDDLVQVGAIGLMKAIERFDLDRGVQLPTYAIPTIAGEIRRHLRDRVSPIKMPRPQSGAAAERPPFVESLSADGDDFPLPGVLERGFELGEDRVALERAFRVLDSRERRVLQLSYFAGLPQSRIGRELGISQIHVSRLARRALDKLRAELEPEGFSWQ
jgi:RNA polymerase sigma-B factor